MKKRIVLFLTIALYSLCSFAQGFSVKEFKQNINDGSAFYAPSDSLGNACGLIRVRTDNPNLHFLGSIIGEVDYKFNEYFVYLTKGSKQLKVIHANFMPLVIDFNSYGIDEIASKSTYILTLRESKFKKEKCCLTLTLKPENAQLFIDDIVIDNLSNNGFYQLYLPKGEHVYRIVHNGYRPIVQTISSGKGPVNLSVNLESVMATLNLKSKTETAEIFVDGELKGNGSWYGDVLPGPHKIEARQKNFDSQIQQIFLEEKENRMISIPELKRSKGRLKFSANLPNMRVMLDGEFVGTSPCEVETETGEHYVSCEAFGCLPYKSNINVSSEKVTNSIITLEFDSNDILARLYPKAYLGDTEAMMALAGNRMLKTWQSGLENIEEAVFWRERIEEIEPHYFSSPSELEFAEEWLWTYESLAEEYEEKGDYPKAIHCYRKFLYIISNEWSPDEYSEYKNPQSYKKEISDKINNLEDYGIKALKGKNANLMTISDASIAQLIEAPVVGTLTAYYALEDFKVDWGEYKKGELICDSNDPFNQVSDEDENNYRYTGDYGGDEYSWLLPKSKVEKKTYTMNQLTASNVGDNAYFVADNGFKARIFLSNINGHHYYDKNGEEAYSYEGTYSKCFVLSVECNPNREFEEHLFEEQLDEKRGSIELYCKNRFDTDGNVPTNCRYRKGLIGLIEEGWYNNDEWDDNKTAYDEDGNLLVDQLMNDGISEYISIAYIADLDALYVNGLLYYKKQ